VQGWKKNGVSPKLCAMQKFFRVARAAKKFSDFGGVRKFLDFAGGKN